MISNSSGFHAYASIGDLSGNFCRPTLQLGDRSVKSFLRESPYGFVVLDAGLTPEVVQSAERLLAINKEYLTLPKPHISTIGFVLEKKQSKVTTLCGEPILTELPTILNDNGSLTNHFHQKMIEFAGQQQDDGYIFGSFSLLHSSEYNSSGPSWEIHADQYTGDFYKSERLTLPYVDLGTVYLLLDNQTRLELNSKLAFSGKSLVNEIMTFEDISRALGLTEVPYSQIQENCMGLHLRGVDTSRQLIGAAHGAPNYIGDRLLGAINNTDSKSVAGLKHIYDTSNRDILDQLRILAGRTA